MIKSTPKQMIEAIKQVAALPGAEPHRDALLDVVRMIAQATSAAAMAKIAAGRFEDVKRLDGETLRA